MKWKYRIIRCEGWFIPQYKSWFKWHPFLEEYTDDEGLKFKTQEEAHDYIGRIINNRLSKTYKKIEVVKEYNL